ncbi:putative HVA22-like protein g [Dioscorea cayenensis subsp. rotundata]|uniref:HVA22-like protein n=1 Tax=Dioscorea cayennensis subsp. rotundata TaxID=55577 RepID=A0AB40B735_DIOCR|nr:putative HVA22-like protein g [Dioscorea cayenensis subsp. rotundata]
MIGSFLSRALVTILGYVYPAYECYKTVELNRPEIEQLRFWCQYWILVATLSALERVGDAFISWLPMYSEAKLAFFVYLWYPKTRGTTYVYNTFFRPYIANYETEIDRNLLELRTRAGDILVLYWKKSASYVQARFFEILQYVASQSRSQTPASQPVQQRQQSTQTPATTATANVQTAPSSQQLTRIPAISAKVQLQPQAPVKPGASSTAAPTVLQPLKPGAPAAAAPTAQPQNLSVGIPHSTSENVADPAPGEAEVMQIVEIDEVESANATPQEAAIEEAIRLTRGRLRKRATNAGPAGR